MKSLFLITFKHIPFRVLWHCYLEAGEYLQYKTRNQLKFSLSECFLVMVVQTHSYAVHNSFPADSFDFFKKDCFNINLCSLLATTLIIISKECILLSFYLIYSKQLLSRHFNFLTRTQSTLPPYYPPPHLSPSVMKFRRSEDSRLRQRVIVSICHLSFRYCKCVQKWISPKGERLKLSITMEV